MTTDRGFTNPNFGSEARVEQYGKEVHVVFVASTETQADDLTERILSQLKAGSLNITLMGKPTSVEKLR